MSQGDAFYGLFLSDACLGRACYDRCKFKYDCSSADIRIGDLWGSTYRSNEEGVSCAVAFTENGDELLRNCGCTLTEHAFATVAEGQMKTSPRRPSYHQRIAKMLAREDTTIGEVHAALRRYQKRQKLVDLASHPRKTAKKVWGKIKTKLGKL